MKIQPNIQHMTYDIRHTILGIDPGLANLGYGIIKKEGNQLNFIKAGLIKTSPNLQLAERLLIIQKKLIELIKKFKVTIIAFEQLFFCKNVKTALVVGQVIGVILLTAGQQKLAIYQYTPLEIKQALTTYGRAEKQQLALIVKLILNLHKTSYPSHATDALACAICCAQKSLWTKN